MEYEVIPSKFFLEQIDELSNEAAKLIEKKLILVKNNPYRFKRIQGYKLFLCRIRFEDERKEKRVIYLVDMSEIYSWFTTSGQSPLSCYGCGYISEHAQKPPEVG